MIKASLSLPNGTVVEIEGSASEVKELLQYYGTKPSTASSSSSRRRTKRRSEALDESRGSSASSDPTPNLAEIVNLVKTCDDAEKIEKTILDRSSQVDRTLLPLYIVHEHLNNSLGLSSGDINKITTDLGVPVSTPNASHTLSGTAAKYVIGDKVRRRGQSVRYKLSRRGIQYMQAVINGSLREE